MKIVYDSSELTRDWQKLQVPPGKTASLAELALLGIITFARLFRALPCQAGRCSLNALSSTLYSR
jgi:hypothetical protein